MTLRSGAQQVAVGTDFFCAPAECVSAEKARCAARRGVHDPEVVRNTDWLDFWPEGMRSRYADYMVNYLVSLDSGNGGDGIPPNGGPIWDLTQNLKMGSLRTSNSLMPALLPNSHMYSVARERLLVPQEAALVQGLVVPSMAEALGSPPYTALFDPKAFVPKPCNLAFFAGQAFHTHIVGAFL
eukprot:13936135-Alexandrium_andersonii.AAC.1